MRDIQPQWIPRSCLITCQASGFSASRRKRDDKCIKRQPSLTSLLLLAVILCEFLVLKQLFQHIIVFLHPTSIRCSVEKKKLNHDDYTVAWICPLEVEQVAALEMLDEEHQRLPQPENDHNAYNLGSVSNHNVVIAGLPTTGNCSAATVVAQMRNTYPRLRFGLLVGIGGGVPTHTDAGPIRLGHIVVSQPVGQHSGAVQYDHGKAEANDFFRTGFLAPPPMVLLNAARELQVARRRASVDPLTSHLERIDITKRGLRNFKRPKADQDHLYDAEYIHLEKGKSCKKCGCDASKRIDLDVDDSEDDSASETDDNWLVIHRGTIASGEVVMRDGLHRDALARDHKILCFEMEAAGALNDFPCLVIRGISGYSDSHKNDRWHGYAAAVAAAYARELFQHMPVEEVKQCKIAETDVERLLHNAQESADYILDSRVKDWLRPPDPSVNLVNACKLRHSDTGRWFLESDRYRWLKIYFFFSFTDESKQKLDYMLRSLIFQLVGWNLSTKAHLLKLFGSSHNGHEQPQTKRLEETFNQMVGELQDVIVVLDALDESKDRRDLLRWITSSASQTCRFVLTSRSERDIEESLAPWLSPDSTISLESDLVGDDIEAYVHGRLKKEKHLSRWKSMHGEIATYLVNKAAGMFRWVYCQLEELSTCLDKPAVRRMLQTLPNDLNETYDRILQNIPASRVPNAIKLLQFLTFSKRPLRLEEIIDAMATEPDIEPPFDAENRVSPPETIIEYCSSLVRIALANSHDLYDSGSSLKDEVEQVGHKNQEQRTIQLAHFSVREYLLLDRKETPHHHHFGHRVAHALITRVYLAYIWTAAEAQNAPERRPKLPLRKHAAQYWIDHAAKAGEEEETTFEWTCKIFMSENFLRYWKRFYFRLSGSDATPVLYYVSEHALQRSASYLLSRGADPNAGGGWYGSALQAASAIGSLQIVQLLLDHGADTNATGGFHGDALHAAAYEGHVNTLNLLLRYGANTGALELERGSAATALQVAAYRGHAQIVEALLMHGADVNERNIFLSRGAQVKTAAEHFTALDAACHQGNIEVVKILLERNAEIDASGFFLGYDVGTGYRHGTPLQTASKQGHLDIVRLLLEIGANVNVESGADGYALHAALSNAHTEVALLLIESGADIQAWGGSHKTALHAAVYGRDLTMVRLLLDNGLDSNEPSNLGECPLIQACRAGSTQIVELLLDNGADPNAERKGVGTALYAASGGSWIANPEVVRLLLVNGADVNAKGGALGTAICVASNTGSVEVVRMLLDNGADVNAQWGNTALYAASNIGSVGIVRMLLDSGADVNAQGGEYGSALYAALGEGNVEVMRLLLDSGADVSAQGEGLGTALCAALGLDEVEELVQILLDKGTDSNAHNPRFDIALYMASYHEDLAVATTLLAYGADPNVLGGELGTALAAASYKGSMRLVEILFDNDADVNFQGGRYGNPLQSSCCPNSYVENPDLIDHLLASGANINAQGGEYGTALCAASSAGKLGIVKLLLLEGADVNAPGGKYDCALCAAAYKGHIDVVRVLMENGAVAGTPEDLYGLAVQEAIGQGNMDIAELLLGEGALERLTIERANPHSGLKRSASSSSMWGLDKRLKSYDQSTSGNRES
ncbi:ankyrin repeat protein, partial [Aureobasidium melanogenum]